MMLKSPVRTLSSASSVATISSISLRENERLLPTSFGGSQERFKTKNAESEKAAKHKKDRVLVLGGNGYVGSHVCKEALKQGFAVSSLNRSGKSSISDSWVTDVTWHRGDLLVSDSLKPALEGITSVISCVGGFGSNSRMFEINGTANIYAVKAAKEQGVERFVYISAADFGFVNYLLRGYFEGKRATEAEILDKFPDRGTILRPGFIHGTRKVGSINLPLSIIGAPLEMVLKYAQPLTRVPIVGPLFIPPVNVTSIAKVAVQAATDPHFPSGLIDVFGIRRHSQTTQTHFSH